MRAADGQRHSPRPARGYGVGRQVLEKPPWLVLLTKCRCPMPHAQPSIELGGYGLRWGMCLLLAWTPWGCKASQAARRGVTPDPSGSRSPGSSSREPHLTWESLPAVAGRGASVDRCVPARPLAALPEYRTRCPPDMAVVAGFCIDRYEAHLASIGSGGCLRPHPHTERPDPNQRYLALSEPGVYPQGYVNRFEAANACANAAKRLCSVTEWYRACSGSRGAQFPYGKRERRDACNNRKPHLLSILFGDDSRGWSYEHFNSPALNREPGFLAKTGEYAGCVSQEGVFDLVGNLHEWVSSTVDHELAEQIPLIGSVHNKLGHSRGHGIFMGGFFSTSAQLGEGCSYLTIGHEPGYHDYSTGFRCCRDAEVATK